MQIIILLLFLLVSCSNIPTSTPSEEVLKDTLQNENLKNGTLVQTENERQQSDNSSKYLTVIGGKILKEANVNFNISRGSEDKFLSYDINQDGKSDAISYWLSTSVGEQKIISSFGDLLEEEDFHKQQNSELWGLIVRVPSEKLPIVLFYYNGSNIDDPLESHLYIFKFKNNELYLAFDTILSYGDNPDSINCSSWTIEDAYGTGGLFEELTVTLK